MYINSKTFKCKQCGECCKIVVKVSNNEINRIKQQGHKDFLEKDPIKGKGYALKRINGNCVFLKDNKCEIYEIRPEICRLYPFLDKNVKISSCKPRDVFPFYKNI